MGMWWAPLNHYFKLGVQRSLLEGELYYQQLMLIDFVIIKDCKKYKAIWEWFMMFKNLLLLDKKKPLVRNCRKLMYSCRVFKQNKEYKIESSCVKSMEGWKRWTDKSLT